MVEGTELVFSKRLRRERFEHMHGERDIAEYLDMLSADEAPRWWETKARSNVPREAKPFSVEDQLLRVIKRAHKARLDESKGEVADYELVSYLEDALRRFRVDVAKRKQPAAQVTAQSEQEPAHVQ